jgi:signal transduction histidine kinase/CheY-like chemotaxis protein/HPt (histidine-containing phosphotransfer) domain-containing protein
LNFNYVYRVAGEPVFATKKGVYRFHENSHRFLPDPRFDGLFPKAPRWILTIKEDTQGRVWMHAQDEGHNIRETGFALLQPDGKYRWEPTPLLRISESTVEYIHPDDNGVVWLGGSDGLFRYDPRVRKDYTQDFQVLLRRVTRKGNQLLFDGTHSDMMPEPALKYRENALRFEFATPSFDLGSANRYQVLLEGYDSAWSPWTAEPFKEYTNLIERTYRFRVRAMNIYGQVSREDMYPFRVLPPWYRTGWAYLLYLGLISFILWAIYRARTRILRARNRMLRAQIGEATLGLQAQAADLERMNGELRLLNEHKNQFFGIVTHDLRNPLNGIVIEAQLIDGEEDLQEIYRAARNIQQDGLEMSALIGRFLNIAAIESGGIKTEKAPFDLWGVAAHLVERHTARAREKGIELRMEPLEGNGTALADLKFTKEVLDNLISNAVKFSPPGKAVSVRVKGDGKRILVSVRDQGPGLTEEDLARLFGRFARLSAQPTGGEKSTGLGLSIVKHMVEAMEGRIWVDSEPGRGAAFHVELSAGSATLPEDIQAPALPQEAPPTLPLEGPPRPAPVEVSNGSSPVRIFRGRVLLAEDNANNRTVEEALLRRLGIDVVGVEDGIQALEALEREPFDIVFLDGQMPRLDGPGTVSEIRRRESTGALFGGHRQVVVALTALADSGGGDGFLASGFDELLSKPLEMVALQEVLDRFLDPGTEPGARMKTKHLDSWEDLAAVLGGPQAFADFLAEILNDADVRLARLQSAFERMDRGQIERDAHDLKSNASTLGLQALAKICSELEHGALNLAPEELCIRLASLPSLLEALRVKCQDYLRS